MCTFMRMEYMYLFLYIVFISFFCFKQKTAYEMRISDWSSDVCSSDLPESQTLASTTFQNYFRLYKKLAGMTGTADTEAFEFQQIYNLPVVVIPTNRPLARKDFNDLVYLTQEEKFAAIISDIKECREQGRPVLVGTATIESSEYVSRLLEAEGFEHKVLNAKHHDKEAEIIAQAGRPGAVTIATNSAGRGTDRKSGV